MGGAPQGELDVWGLISDVHGNYPALELAIGALQRAGATKLAFLGDYLGRGDSDRCVALIQDVADIAIVGNRDLDWQDRVSADSKAWILELPRSACAGDLLVSHGDARLTPTLCTGQIARDFVKVWPVMERAQASVWAFRVWAFGHSHFARTWRKADLRERGELLNGSTNDNAVTMDATSRYIVNVGTTGLPFPGKGGPSVALVDFTHGEIRHLALDQV